MTNDDKAPRGGEVPRRRYGKDEIALSVIGLGGVAVMEMAQPEADMLVAEAIERGVNYFDVAPTYGDSELRYGPALKPYRDRIFLACKTGERTAEGARAQLEQSLARLHTDHLDLYQLHGLGSIAKDVDVAFGAGGAMEVFIEGKRAGRIRHLGFSAHSEEAALAAMDRYDFDSILFPINFACWLKNGFGPSVVTAARAKGVTILALKALARQRWPQNHPKRQVYKNCWYEPCYEPELAKLALRWALSQPITAAVAPGSEAMFRMALDVAAGFRPITADETARLAELAPTLNAIMPAPPRPPASA
ncbi:MAG TPA: aldo/keto reductase [Phycisphaerae bacterium]|nr:aldo/keto reductase [Phycisphaerae bacterium]